MADRLGMCGVLPKPSVVVMMIEKTSYSGWMTSARAAHELGLTVRRVEQLCTGPRKKLRSVMVGVPGRLMPIGHENNKLNGKVIYQQCRGSLELRIDPESVFELVREFDRRDRQIGANKISRAAKRQEFFASHVKRFSTGWEKDYQYHDDDQEPNG